MKPVFVGGRLVAFASTTAHVPDIGGRLRAIESRQIFEEGFQIPLMKLVDGGDMDQTLVRLLRQNVRTPEQTLGDIWAQLSGAQRLTVGAVALGHHHHPPRASIASPMGCPFATMPQPARPRGPRGRPPPPDRTPSPATATRG